MPHFRKKPVVIEAHQWFKNGDHPRDAIGVDCSSQGGPTECEGKIVRYFRHPNIDGLSICKYCRNQMHHHGWIDTMEGGHIVCPGDWIITGIKGENYPCKPDVFDATYEPAEARRKGGGK